jgi:hypothetical protein
MPGEFAAATGAALRADRPSPGGVARLRELILTLAVQGKLVPQDNSDELASELVLVYGWTELD